jgi:hypothetical protein
MVAVIRLLFLALTATAASIIPRDAITVQNDITQKIGPQLTTLNTNINAYPSSGEDGAKAIHENFATLVTTLNNTVKDIKDTGSFGTVAGTTIIAEIQLQVPTWLATLAAAGAQAPVWEVVKGGKARMLGNLRSLQTAYLGFIDAVTAAEPLLLKAAAIAIKTQLSGAFTTAVEAYV